MPSSTLELRGFSHVCINVSDMELSLAFYRDVLGLRVIFDVELAGEGLEAVTGEGGARGRMVGCLVPGSRVTVELLSFGHRAPASRRGPSGGPGYSNIALTVVDLAAAWAALEVRGARPQPPADVGGVRMFFVRDPDGTPIEIIEFPGGALSSADHNGA
jgi:glyoxylase I family protein